MASAPAPPLTAGRAAGRGALVGAAGAGAVLGAAAAWPPALLLRLVGPDPAPRFLALAALAAALPAGAVLGRRAFGLCAAPGRRRRVLFAWTFVAYLASATSGAAALAVAAEGPGALADPFGLVRSGLAVALLLLPWGAVPVAAAAVALERWTRPVARADAGPGGGPGPGSRAPADRRAERSPPREAA